MGAKADPDLGPPGGRASAAASRPCPPPERSLRIASGASTAGHTWWGGVAQAPTQEVPPAQLDQCLSAEGCLATKNHQGCRTAPNNLRQGKLARGRNRTVTRVRTIEFR